MNPQQKRFFGDYNRLRELELRSPLISILDTTSVPPEAYIFEIKCKSVIKIGPTDEPIIGREHQLGIKLTNNYPRALPLCQMLTPIFHPNIAGNGSVCIGDDLEHGWSPSSRIDDVIIRIVQMLRYENYNPSRPLNSVAAAWALENAHLFPLETGQVVREDPIKVSDTDLDKIIIFGDEDSDFSINIL